MSDAGSTLQSVTNALRLLEAFSSTQPELGIAELSRKLELGKSTVHRLVSTLEEHGFVAQNPATGKYRLGLTVVHLGSLALGQMNLVRDSQPFLEELTARSGEASFLAVLQRGKVVYLNKVESTHALRMGATLGSRLPAYCTATGKVLLAHLPESELERYLSEAQLVRLTPATVTDPGELRRRLEAARTQGYSLDREEVEAGLMSVAAPVYNGLGRVVAAISAAGPTLRYDPRQDEIKNLVIAAAADMSRSMGWNPAL